MGSHHEKTGGRKSRDTLPLSKTRIQKEKPKKNSSYEYQPLKKVKKDTLWKI